LLSAKSYGLVEKCDKCSMYCSKKSAGQPAQRSYVRNETTDSKACQHNMYRNRNYVADHANLQYKE
jgi:hypothetical protein